MLWKLSPWRLSAECSLLAPSPSPPLHTTPPPTSSPPCSPVLPSPEIEVAVEVSEVVVEVSVDSVEVPEVVVEVSVLSRGPRGSTRGFCRLSRGPRGSSRGRHCGSGRHTLSKQDSMGDRRAGLQLELQLVYQFHQSIFSGFPLSFLLCYRPQSLQLHSLILSLQLIA